MSSLWVKICGIRDPETAIAVAVCRPDAIGLNFYARSPRCIDVATAREIVAALPPDVPAVGVFVDQPAAEVSRICRETGIAAAQLHGDQSPEFAADLAGLDVIRVYRVSDEEDIRRIGADFAACRTLGVTPLACLVEGRHPGLGGAGRRGPWPAIAQEWNYSEWPPLLLAGGLTPGNVAEAIRLVHPWGVDVASGVESAPGTKDVALVSQFITEARSATIGR